MARIITSIYFLLASCFVEAQNVGIGTNTPTYQLTIAHTDLSGPSPTGIAIIQKNTNSTLLLQSFEGAASILTTSNSGIRLGTNNQTRMTISETGNVGSGIINPAYKLQVTGNVNFTGNTLITGNTSIDGNTSITGKTGLGTVDPTAQLDVAGTIRFRNSFPKKGSVLTSEDANGNASWQDPVAFRVINLAGGVNQIVNEDAWTKVTFNTNTSYNLGSNYQPYLSQFLVGEKGIYEFKAQITYHGDYRCNGKNSLRLMVNRNGNVFAFAERIYNQPLAIPIGAGTTLSSLAQSIMSDAPLEPGDVVWVETFISDVYQGNAATNSAPILANSLYTFFSGSLIARY